jgi:tRNA nucleotidyltransferase (CCA-adding enzyme)
MTEITPEFKRKILEYISERGDILEDKREAVSSISRRLEKVKDDYRLKYDIFLGGSFAKGTDIKGSDIDIFLLFPEEYDPMKILRILRREFPESTEEYSEHPYVIIKGENFSIDIVPAYMAKSPGNLMTAVDRTPFHVEFVKNNFTSQMKDEARIMKQFMKAIGVYGAEASVQGFSGYVAELIIYHYGSFEGAIDKAATWTIPFFMDDGDRKFKGANLVIIDPVDNTRNASANVSKENLSTFILAAKLFQMRPSEAFFSSTRTDCRMPGNAIVVVVPCKKCNEQTDVPNLRRVSSVLKKELESVGFNVIYTSVFVDRAGYIVIIPDAERMGEASLHIGPPVTSANVIDFLKKWGEGTRFGPPFMLGDRVAVMRERDPVDVMGAIADTLPRVKFSNNFIPEKIIIVEGGDIAKLPENITSHFIYPSLGKWASPSYRDYVQ